MMMFDSGHGGVGLRQHNGISGAQQRSFSPPRQPVHVLAR
jgi:hypothetical protein